MMMILIYILVTVCRSLDIHKNSLFKHRFGFVKREKLEGHKGVGDVIYIKYIL